MSCARRINLRIYWPFLVIKLSDQHRHHWLMTKERLTAKQKKNASKITHLVPVLCNPTTKSTSHATAIQFRQSETYFQRINDPAIYSLVWLNPSADATNTISLPADFLGNTSVSFIDISGYYFNSSLVIDPLAFHSSHNSLVKFFVSNFDFSLQKDFNFLNGFNKLKHLSISRIVNLTAFQYLPPLMPSLQKLEVDRCPEINQIAFPDLSPTKLKRLYLYSNEISDEKADSFVAKLAASNLADSLDWLDLVGNSLTRIPNQVGSIFPKLNYIFLSGNNMSHIPSSSVTFAYPLRELILYGNGIKTIESDAFRGKSTAALLQVFSFC